MRKLLNLLMMTVLALCFSLPTWSKAEAATVAVLPLVNNTEDHPDLATVYWYKLFDVMHISHDELVEDDVVAAAMAKYKVEENTFPSNEALMGIAKECKADYVIAMQVDKLSREDLLSSNVSDYFVTVKLDGKAACYDAKANKFKNTRLMDDETMDASLTARYDVLTELFSNNVSRYIKRVLKVKKVTIERPRVGIK